MSEPHRHHGAKGAAPLTAGASVWCQLGQAQMRAGLPCRALPSIARWAVRPPGGQWLARARLFAAERGWPRLHGL